MEAATRDVSAVVHLAGMIGNYDLESLLRVNARGLFDVIETARLGGVKRIDFASSNHAFGCYPITEPVSPALSPRPDSLYGVFKRHQRVPMILSPWGRKSWTNGGSTR
jgi:nucleoside-diphosphate-sugar epimerase